MTVIALKWVLRRDNFYLFYYETVQPCLSRIEWFMWIMSENDGRFLFISTLGVYYFVKSYLMLCF